MDNVINLTDFIEQNKDRILKAANPPILWNHDPNKRMIIPPGKGLADVIPMSQISLLSRQATSDDPPARIVIACSEDLYNLSDTDLDAFIDKIFGGLLSDMFDIDLGELK